MVTRAFNTMKINKCKQALHSQVFALPLPCTLFLQVFYHPGGKDFVLKKIKSYFDKIPNFHLLKLNFVLTSFFVHPATYYYYYYYYYYYFFIRSNPNTLVQIVCLCASSVNSCLMFPCACFVSYDRVTPLVGMMGHRMFFPTGDPMSPV